MGYYFNNAIKQEDLHSIVLRSFGARLDNEEKLRLRNIERGWNFYEGYHYEEIGDTDKPQVTVNYCKAFVNKFVAFEFGNPFNIKMKPHIEAIDGENDPLDFLNYVWEDNDKMERCLEIGQSKSIAGDSWIQVVYEPKYFADGRRNESFEDPFEEYEKGRIRLVVVPSSIVFPRYDDTYDKSKMKALEIMYPIETEDSTTFGKKKVKTKLYRQVWTTKSIEIYINDELIQTLPNKYGIIPFIQFKNFIRSGKNYGISDLDDVIPINVEMNLKRSDISEIIDYHSAPVTVVFGARIGQLERGANKVWGGLPKDARVENLRLEGDLTSAQNYIADLKTAMHEVGAIPEGALGGNLAISNTSGVALEMVLMPLLERVKMKQVLTKEALEWTNKIILLIAVKEGLLQIPEGVNRKDFFYNEVHFESILPKDSLLELQEIELEMRLGLESREGAMKRTGKSNIQNKISEVDEDMKKNPALYGKEDVQSKIELMREQRKLGGEEVKISKSDSTEKKVGVNKEGKPKKINSGFTNGSEPKR